MSLRVDTKPKREDGRKRLKSKCPGCKIFRLKAWRMDDHIEVRCTVCGWMKKVMDEEKSV